MRHSAEPGARLARPLKFAPLLWAWLWRRPGRTVLAFVAVMLAFTLYGLALGEAEGFARAAAARHVNIGQGFLLGAMAVSAIGFGLILFLTANATAQGVRLRLGEFGTLKAIGFPHRLILALVMTEAALPCLAGAVAGLVAAPLLFAILKAALPPLAVFPALVYTPAMLAVAAALAVFIGGASGLLPALRVTRLDVAAALAGGLRATTSPRRDGGDAPRQSAAGVTAAPPAAEGGTRRIIKTDMHPLRQIAVVTRVGLSTLPLRLKGAVVIVVGVGVMVFVLLYILSIGEGIRLLMPKSGDPSIVLIHPENDRWLDRGGLAPTASQVVASGPGIAQGKDGAPLMEAEVSLGINLIKRNNGKTGSTGILGVGSRWAQIRPSFHLLSGRMPRPGTRELLAGDLARRKFVGLDEGRILAKASLSAFDAKIGTYAHHVVPQWRIVGTFSTGDLLDGYLIGSASALKAAVNQATDDVVRVRLISPSSFDVFRRAVIKRLPPGLIVERETDYYAGMWRRIADTSPAFTIAYILAGLIGIGMIAGTMHTMQSALEERAREIAILRALGFDGLAVAASVILEAMLLAGAGAILGAAIVWLWMNGFLYNAAGSVYIVRVNLRLLLVGSLWGLAVAFGGSLTIAIKAARQTPIEALREV